MLHLSFTSSNPLFSLYSSNYAECSCKDKTFLKRLAFNKLLAQSCSTSSLDCCRMCTAKFDRFILHIITARGHLNQKQCSLLHSLKQRFSYTCNWFKSLYIFKECNATNCMALLQLICIVLVKLSLAYDCYLWSREIAISWFKFYTQYYCTILGKTWEA